MYISKNTRLAVILIPIVLSFCTVLQGQNNKVHYLNEDKVMVQPIAEDTLIYLKGFNLLDAKKPTDGIWTIYYDKSLKNKAQQITVKDGQIMGPKTSWYRNGNEKEDGLYAHWNCLKDCRKYYESGQIRYERLYAKGIDIERYWYETGEINELTQYIDKIAVKTISYYKNGMVKRELFYKKSNTRMEGYEPFMGVEYNEEGLIIGTLSFTQKTVINPSDYSEHIIRTVEIDSFYQKK